MPTVKYYNFEWDEDKNILNFKKHKIRFETAAKVFTDPYRLEAYDYTHSVEEDRYSAIGKVGNIIFVVFTQRTENIRIISARIATKAEKARYYGDYGTI